MQSSDSGLYFETDASQAERKRKEAKAGNKNGHPVALQSKLNAVIVDPDSPVTGVLVAESTGSVRRLDVKSGITKTLYKGGKVPMTSIAIGGPGNSLLLAGCWNSVIWTWDLASGVLLRQYKGHTDFVKTTICTTVKSTPIIITGGADKNIMVWDLSSSRRLHVLSDPTLPMMAVQHLAVDPVLSTPDAIVIASAGSDPHIRMWRIDLTCHEQLPAAPPQPLQPPQTSESRAAAGNPSTASVDARTSIREHETTVYRLAFDADGDLWTASADGTVKCLSREAGFTADDTLVHGSAVRAVAVTEAWVATAGRDEDVKIWDRASGQLYAVLPGHYDEVTDMVVLRGSGRSEELCTVSLDGTVRTWPLGKTELDALVKEMKEVTRGEDGKDGRKDGKSALTAEEEAELANLMEDD